MKVKVNEVELFEIDETTKRVICHDIHEDDFERDMKRRLEWIVRHKYERCLERLKKEWIPKLQQAGIQQLPLDNAELVTLITSQPEYKDRKAREAVATKK